MPVENPPAPGKRHNSPQSSSLSFDTPSTPGSLHEQGAAAPTTIRQVDTQISQSQEGHPIHSQQPHNVSSQNIFPLSCFVQSKHQPSSTEGHSNKKADVASKVDSAIIMINKESVCGRGGHFMDNKAARKKRWYPATKYCLL